MNKHFVYFHHELGKNLNKQKPDEKISSPENLSQLITLAITPAPTVRPPSLMANLCPIKIVERSRNVQKLKKRELEISEQKWGFFNSPTSRGTGNIRSNEAVTLSPGITILMFSGNMIVPVTSAVLM